MAWGKNEVHYRILFVWPKAAGTLNFAMGERQKFVRVEVLEFDAKSKEPMLRNGRYCYDNDFYMTIGNGRLDGNQSMSEVKWCTVSNVIADECIFRCAP